jgi:hypothetical protein
MNTKIRSLFFLLIVFLLAANNSSAQEDILFRRHIINSGVNGLFYGGAIDVIAELEGGAAAGVPLITAGGSMLLPLLTNRKKEIDYDALVLNNHGKTIGWGQGFALATLVAGDKAWKGVKEEDSTSNNYKYTVGFGALSSIGLGILGYSLARNNEWSEGQVELYRLYGWIMPYTGFSLMASFTDEPRLYGASVLLFGAGGYLLADRVNTWHEYSRGDMRATQVLTALNFGLGWGIFADLIDEEEWEDAQTPYWLIPAAGALSGTLIGHFWLKNKNLTPQQGMLTVYATSGGAILGLGIAAITKSENITPYYLIPYATGLAAFATTVELLGRKNASQAFLTSKKKNNFNLTFMPQNLFLNNMIQKNNNLVNYRGSGMQPLFVASLKF